MIDRGGRCAGHGANIHHQEAVVKYFNYKFFLYFLESVRGDGAHNVERSHGEPG